MHESSKQANLKRLLVVAGLIQRNSNDIEFLVTRRAMTGHLPGSWELPGGKVEPGEPPESALHRELREELGIEVHIDRIFSVGHHVYADREVVLMVYRTRLKSGTPECLVALEAEWLTAAQVLQLDFPPANYSFVKRMKTEYL